MATGDSKNTSNRTLARIRSFFGVRESSAVSETPGGKLSTALTPPKASVHFGSYSGDEFRHMDFMLDRSRSQLNRANGGSSFGLNDQSITAYLTNVATNTRKKIDELKNLRILAPEIDQARSIIISSMMSPIDLQTDAVTVKVSCQSLGEALNTKITNYLTNYFNKEYHLGPKLYGWLGKAGFEEGATALLVLPKHQLDVLNVVADKWRPEETEELAKLKKEIANSKMSVKASTESFGATFDKILSREKRLSLPPDQRFEAVVEGFATQMLNDNCIGKEHLYNEGAEWVKEHGVSESDAPIPSREIAKVLTEGSFKLLRTTERGDAVVVTRDMSLLGKPQRDQSAKLAELVKDAELQITGFDGSDRGMIPSNPVLTISDVIKTGEGDMPLVLEIPTDAVIPVCSPGDNKNHIGYFIMVDEHGLPCRGLYAFDQNIDNDTNNRLAMNAAKSVFGMKTVSTYMASGVSQQQMLEQMTQIFAVAVNHLLNAKMQEDGLKGLDVHLHEAVGKCLFYNLLAKNHIKLIFVPATMLIYYRFDHRDDGTGKTFLEDIAFILALRTTLTIAKIMAIVENATKHRKIEVQIDENNQEPIQTLEMARHAYLNKKAPVFTNNPMTAAEDILSRHLSIVPKGLVGNTDDLTVTTEQDYGHAQPPDEQLPDTLNNWVCQGLKLPPSALNQLNETEYAKSVSTTNLFFSNNVRNWQNIIAPFNSRFVIAYTLSNQQMLDDIKAMIKKDFEGSSNTKKNIQEGEDQRDANDDLNKDTKVEDALKMILATMEIALPPPVMATSKAHYEELTAQLEATQKMLEALYPDDIAPNDELRGLMTALRAIASSDLMRKFLPRLGFHEIASVPSLAELKTNIVTDAILRLANLQRKVTNLSKLSTGQLADQFASESGGMEEGGIGDETAPEESGDQNPMGSDFGI